MTCEICEYTAAVLVEDICIPCWRESPMVANAREQLAEHGHACACDDCAEALTEIAFVNARIDRALGKGETA